VLGVSCQEYRQHGAFAEYVAVPQRILYRLPETVSFARAAMVEPVSVAFHAAALTPISLNDTAVVVGSGMIGLLVIQALRLAGCGQIIAVDLAPEKLALATQAGADVILQADQTDIAADVFKLTENRGADMAFEVVGNTTALNTAAASVRKGGTIPLIGNLSSTVDLPLQTIVTRQIRVQGSCASNGEYPACLAMIAAGKINVDMLISKVAPLSEGGDWFQKLYNGEDHLMKVILEP
jgi:L-iditol 2-dehydrogenase